MTYAGKLQDEIRGRVYTALDALHGINTHMLLGAGVSPEDYACFRLACEKLRKLAESLRVSRETGGSGES